MAVGGVLDLIERGQPIVLSGRSWGDSGLDEFVDRLTASGVVSVEASGGFVVIRPRQYIGQLRLPNRALTISPRNPFLFRSLQAYVSKLPVKKVPDGTSQEHDEEHERDIAERFAAALDAGITSGLPIEYARTKRNTSLPVGRVVFNETFRLFASRGIDYRVVCAGFERQYPAPLLAVLATASYVLHAGGLAQPRTMQRIGDLMNAIAPGNEGTDIPEALAQLPALSIAYSFWPETSELLDVARSILEGETQIWDQFITVPGGSARFCNMDRLWELALLQAARSAVITIGNFRPEFHPYSRAALTLFSDGGPTIDPDIVVFGTNAPTLVLDAKYSETDSWGADDVYQVVCYARRLGAPRAALVYLAKNSGWSAQVGVTDDGITISAFGIDSRNAPTELTKAIRSLLN